MGFYQNKLKTYSKYITFNPKLMAVTQEKIISAKESNLQKLKDEIRLNKRFHLENMSDTSEIDVALAEKEIAFMKSLNTVDFYQYLINVENYNLVELMQQSANKRNECARTIDKYSNLKGIANNKISASLAGRKVEKNNKILKEEDLKLGFISESMNEWKGLIPDDHVIYLVGRYELEGKSGFDMESFNHYREEIYKLRHIKDDATHKVVPNEKG